MGKKAEITRVSPPILLWPSEEILNKLKFFQNKDKNPTGKTNNRDSQSYVQVSFPNIRKILKIKESFSNISSKKVEEIHKMINNSGKSKLKINIATKGLSRW